MSDVEPVIMETLSSAIYVRELSLQVKEGNREKSLLTNISLDIPQGSFVAIIGSSGCGKSTLLRCLAGVQSFNQGELRLAGYPVETLSNEFPLAIGYLPQFGAFHETLTVAEVLTFSADLRLPASVEKAARQNWISHITKLAGLDALLDQPYRTLSGGQRRRIALAEELIGDPPFLFLDELTSGLDAHSDLEMMVWLQKLAHSSRKTVCLVTHAVNHLNLCDSVIFLHQGRVIYHGPFDRLLETFRANSIEEIYALVEQSEIESLPELHANNLIAQSPAPQALQTAKPPLGWRQLFILLYRQWILFKRDRAQLWLQLILIITFPALVVIFATDGLPQVRNLSLTIDKNILSTLNEQLLYLKEAYSAASLISGLVMFQVILLTLMGANNGAREIAKERDILNKELRVGLSPLAYVLTKFILVAIISLIQAAWMTWFVKAICQFPGDGMVQCSVLYAVTLAMSTACLAISAASKTPERASLLAIYLVGLQLPLSGAVLALPAIISWITRPFIVAYWGWSGYLKSFSSYRHYDVVKQGTDTFIASSEWSLLVLSAHVVLVLALCWYFVGQQSKR